MNLLENSVLLGADEVISFFRKACEENPIIVLYQGEYVIGDITAITKDNRFVLDVDIPGNKFFELYSKQFKDVTVTYTETEIQLRNI